MSSVRPSHSWDREGGIETRKKKEGGKRHSFELRHQRRSERAHQKSVTAVFASDHHRRRGGGGGEGEGEGGYAPRGNCQGRHSSMDFQAISHREYFAMI